MPGKHPDAEFDPIRRMLRAEPASVQRRPFKTGVWEIDGSGKAILVARARRGRGAAVELLDETQRLLRFAQSHTRRPRLLFAVVGGFHADPDDRYDLQMIEAALLSGAAHEVVVTSLSGLTENLHTAERFFSTLRASGGRLHDITANRDFPLSDALEQMFAMAPIAIAHSDYTRMRQRRDAAQRLPRP